MSNKDLLDNIKKLREMTGVGFKDCKIALDETKGDIDKSIEFLRKKGIAKASKKMSRTASEGLVLVNEIDGKVSIIEINSETDFVAKNNDFISFCKEISEINLKESGNLDNINKSIMHNNVDVKNNLIDLIAKMGEKITLRRSKFFDKSEGKNYFYVHGSVEKNIGKIISIVKLKNINDKNKDLGTKLAMHITAASPLSIDKNDLDKSLIDKELEIIKAEIVNSGKKPEIAEKIAKGKLNKFISDSTLMNQDWIMDPKIKVSDILKDLKVLDFVRYKVGEGV